MQISAADWNRYINRLAKVNEAAANQMREYIRRHGTDDVDALIQMANAIATKYGEAAAAVTCDMYDAIAEAQGAELAPAVPAMTPSIEETGNVVRSALERAPASLAAEIGKLVKKTSTRTMRKNAARDDALMALVPCGDGCPFCKMLGSRGWKPARESKSFEAHLHKDCRCEYVVRFGDDLEVEGYDPDALYEEFQQYEGSWDEKMKAMKRDQRSMKSEKHPSHIHAKDAKKNTPGAIKNGQADNIISQAIDLRMAVSMDDFTYDEMAALSDYVSFRSYVINYKLRRGIKTSQLSEDEHVFVRNLDTALLKMDNYSGIVYRSIDIDLMDEEDFNAKHVIGAFVLYDAYTSTSKSVYDENMKYQFVIKSKRGKDISWYNENEKEILFRRGSGFIVTNREGNTIYMEEV